MDVIRSFAPDFSLLRLAAWIPEAVWAAVVSAAATLVLLRLFVRRPVRQAPAGEPGTCDFAIEGRRVTALNAEARALEAELPAADSPLEALVGHLVEDCPGIREHLEALVLQGAAFRFHCPRDDGSALDIHGAPRGGSAILSLRKASEDVRALQHTRASLERVRAETRFLRELLDRAPTLAWSIAADGNVAWANAAYRERFGVPMDGAEPRIPDAFARVIDEVPLTARPGNSRRRVSVAGGQDGDPRWYEVSQGPGPEGATFGFAIDAEDLVAAEASLRRFVETLTETFAHLPIGLAVFDKNRRLGLFNPSLTQLLKIDAVWLAGRPSLREFLERLRETRQMPDQPDFASFRRKLTELEEGARHGTYEENWVLTSGKVFRVSGRPHPQGALAFLFEDISTAISLERRYRSELELSQATLDRMSEGVAVFDASGMLVFVNSAFERMWGLEPMARLSGPGVGEMTRLWEERCAPTRLWDELRGFATGGQARTSFTTEVETRDGWRLRVLVAPLPDASALVVFRDLTADGIERTRAGAPAPEADPTLASLAIEQIHAPAEAAVRQLAAAIPSAATPEAFQALSAAAQMLKDGLARSREIDALAQSDAAAAPAFPVRGLEPALAARGLSLEFAPQVPIDDPVLRRAIWATMLAAADLATPGAAIGLRVSREGGATQIKASTDIGLQGPRLDGVGVALARRVLESGGGTLRLEPDAGNGKIAVLAALPLKEGRATPDTAVSA